MLTNAYCSLSYLLYGPPCERVHPQPRTPRNLIKMFLDLKEFIGVLVDNISQLPASLSPLTYLSL
jgi:hypothetical protein